MALTMRADSTHPVIASLDHPLFAARKEGLLKAFVLFFLPPPLCEAERVDQRQRSRGESIL